jgi:hypothetical protein
MALGLVPQRSLPPACRAKLSQVWPSIHGHNELRFVLIAVASLAAVYLLSLLVSLMATYEWIP